jgi:hypothetical protein
VKFQVGGEEIQPATSVKGHDLRFSRGGGSCKGGKDGGRVGKDHAPYEVAG